MKLLSSVFLIFLASTSLTTHIYDRNWQEFYVVDFTLLYNLAAVALFGVIYSLCIRHIEKHPKTKRKWMNIYLMIMLMLYVGVFLMFQVPLWDQLDIYNAVQKLNAGDLSFFNELYFQMWQHTVPQVVFQSLFGSNYMAFYIYNGVLYFVTFIILMKMFNYSKHLAVLYILFTPLVGYTCFYYGEITMIFGMIVSFYLLTEIYYGREKWWHFIVLPLLTFIVFFEKMNFIIFVIAEVLTLLLFFIKKHNLKLLLCILLLVSSAAAVKPFTNYLIKDVYQQEVKDFGYTPWIAMGMQAPGEIEDLPSTLEGGYNGYNSLLMSTYVNKEEKVKEIATAEIKEHIDLFINDPAYAASFYYNKVAKQWCTSDWSTTHMLKLASFKTLNTILEENSIMREDGYYNKVDIVQDLFLKGLLILVYLVSLYNIVRAKHLSFSETLLYVFFIGNFLFSILWEAKPRYCMFGFFALLIAAVPQIELWWEKLSRKIEYLWSS